MTVTKAGGYLNKVQSKHIDSLTDLFYSAEFSFTTSIAASLMRHVNSPEAWFRYSFSFQT